jgi:hypothetical protein
MQRVRDDLLAAGLTVWTDEGIEPGTPLWNDAIEKAIKNAGCLVVILSPETKQSTWVKRELDYAHLQKIPIFPVLVQDDERDSIPSTLVGCQFADLRIHYAHELKKLVASISKHVDLESGRSVQNG